MKRNEGTIVRVGVGNADVRIGATLHHGVPVAGLDYAQLQAGDRVAVKWLGEKPSVQSLLDYKETAGGIPAGVAAAATQGDTVIVESRIDTLQLVDKDGGIADPDSNSQILMQAGAGISPTASGNRVLFSHATGDIGDVHPNYTEHDQQEAVTEVWNFCSKLLVSDSSALTSTSPWAVAEVRSSDTTHLRLSYDGDNYAELSAAVDGSLTLSPSGTAVHVTENLIVDKDTGLGTSSPRRALDVLDNAAPQIRLTHTDNSVYTDLKTTEDGYFLIEPSGGRMQLDLDLEFIGSQKILTSLDSLILEPADQLHLNPLGDEVIFTNWGAGKAFESDDYASQTTGFSIAYGSTGGHCDFRSGYFDELHVKAFIAEIYEAFVGGIVVTKSKGRLSRDFVIPANAATGTLYVEDLEGWEGVQLFQDGDYVLLRYIDMSGGGLIVADVWGSVVFVQDEGGGEQSYTWTTTDDGDVDGSSVYRGAVALDYGQPASGSRGVWEATVLDQAGAPYSQVKTWETNPWTAGNWTVRTRLGNLDGISGIGLEYGLWAGQGTGSDDQYFIMSDAQADLHNMPMTFHDGTNTRIKLEPLVSSGGPYISVGNTAPSSYLGGDGFWVGNDSGTYKAFLGDADGERMQWDGDEFGIYAATGDPLFITGPAGNWMSSLMVSESMGQWIFSQNNGLALWGPGCEISPTAWTSTRGQQAAITGAFHQEQGAWAGTRGLVIERGTTNLIVNPQFYTNITDGWTTVATGTAAGSRVRYTNISFIGPASLQLNKTGGAAGDLWGQYASIGNSVAGTSYTASCRAYIATASTTVRIYVLKLAGTGVQQLEYAEITGAPIGQWITLATPALTANATGDAMRVYVVVYGAPTCIGLFDAIQCEATGAATSYCDGSLDWCAWDTPASPHNSTSTRTQTVVSVPAAASLLSSRAAYSIRIVVQMPYAADAAWPFATLNAVWSGDATDVALYYNDDTDTFRLYIEGAARISSPVQTFAAGDVLDIVVTFDYASDLYYMYINGVLAGSYTSARTSPALTNFYLGCNSTTYAAGIVFSEFAVFGTVLTADQVAAMYALRRPLVDAGSTAAPGLYILDGKVRIASSTTGNRLDLNNYSLAIGNGVTYNSGTGVWLGLDGGTTPKFFIGNSAADKMTWDGSSLDITGNITADSGAIAGWTMISNALYKLDSGTPTSTPNNGITLQTVGGTNSKPVIKVYDGTTMNAALGNYASGKYGIYAIEGAIGGWTINATNIYNTHMGMESDNERLWIHGSTFANAGIQLEYNGGFPRAYIGNGSTEYFKYTGSGLDILTGGGALRFNSVGFQFKLGGLYTGDGASGIGVVWKTVFDDVTPANEKTQGYIRMVPQISPNKPYLELVSGSADNNYYCNIAMRTVTDSGTRTPIFIDGDAQRVSIYDTTPADATFSVLNPGNNEPTCSFQQIASDKAVLHLKHTHANVYYFNFEGGHTDRDGYNAVRVYLQGVGTRWIRLYDTND